MAEEAIKTQEDGSAPAEKSPEQDPAEKKEPTMADIQKQAADGTAPKGKEPKATVGLPKYMAEKTKRQELEGEVARLTAELNKGGSSKEQIADDIDALVKEYEDVDPTFLNKLVGVIEKRAEAKFGDKIREEVEPLKESVQEKRINDAFKTHFDKAMSNMPEYKDVVDPNVIKTLSLDPANEDKTFAEIIEETYGKFVTGKKTMEDKTQPGGGKDPETIDYSKAKKDPAYFKTIMANPRLKAEYNKGLENRIGS